MDLDRAIIKQQARALIKGHVLKLFVVTMIVTALVSAGDIASGIIDGFREDKPSSYSEFSDYFNEYRDYFENGGESESMPQFPSDGFDSDHFDSFNGRIAAINAARYPFVHIDKSNVADKLVSLLKLVGIVMLPTLISLCGYYWLFIKGKTMTLENSIRYVFENAFDRHFGRRLGGTLVFSLLAVLLCMLFIFPGVIFCYKYRFYMYVMAEKPELTWRQAMQLSKKMTQDHKGELFVMDLSFILWYLLIPLTAGIASIYVAPYVKTTEALYYENFKIRAAQEGRISALDFMSDREKTAAYCQQTPNQTFQQLPNEKFGSNMDNDYYNGINK